MVSYRMLDIGAALEGSQESPIITAKNINPYPTLQVRDLSLQSMNVKQLFFQHFHCLDPLTNLVLNFSTTLSTASTFIDGTHVPQIEASSWTTYIFYLH
jgi:hypothetical protein